jgi:hypothetical protein
MPLPQLRCFLPCVFILTQEFSDQCRSNTKAEGTVCNPTFHCFKHIKHKGNARKESSGLGARPWLSRQ